MTATGRPDGTASLAPQSGPWRTELTDLIRGASGGLLFGVPLLYTMEVWWTGSRTSPEQMIVVLALLVVPVFVLNKTTGFRADADVRFLDASADTVETIALGVVVTTGVLVLLRQITLDTPVAAGVGMVVYEAVPFCLGIGVAHHFLRGARDADQQTSDDDDAESAAEPTSVADRGSVEAKGTLADLGATALGAVFVSLSIAPTDEVPLIASSIEPIWSLLFIAASLVISYAIVFIAGFARQDQRHAQQGIFQRPVTETVACYLIALLVAGVMLWLFQRGLDPWPDLLTRVVILGLPATIGGAAGRLAV